MTSTYDEYRITLTGNSFTVTGNHPFVAGSSVSDETNASGSDIYLGDVSNDEFRATTANGNPNFFFTGVTTIAIGNDTVQGFIAETSLSSGVYRLFVVAGTPGIDNTTRGTVVPDNTSNRSTQWDLATNAIACFLAGTRVQTPNGPIAIEALAAGDVVTTAVGGSEPVRWIGRRAVARNFADPVKLLPIRVKAGALADNLPERDLLVSPDHALLLDGVLVQAGALVNGSTVVRETDVAETFTYYHVELANHDLILVEGVAAETFIDNVDRMGFDNWAEHEALSPASAPMAELDLPRVKSARQLPAPLRERLAGRTDPVMLAA